MRTVSCQMWRVGAAGSSRGRTNEGENADKDAGQTSLVGQLHAFSTLGAEPRARGQSATANVDPEGVDGNIHTNGLALIDSTAHID